MVEEKKKKTAKQRPPRRSRLRRFGSVVKWMFILGILGLLFAGGAVAGYVTSIVKEDPVRSEELIQQQVSQNAITGFAYFRDGQPIGQLRTEEDRRLIEFNDIPQLVIDAVLAIEDNSFYDHVGIDFSGTLRAVKQKLLNESVQTGGSTLTQQLARRVFLSLDRTEDRKVKEILLSLRLERFLSKNEILTAYLNKVPFGNGSNGYNVFGIKAAAKGIFGLDDLDKLNIAQAAYLAGLPQLPPSIPPLVVSASLTKPPSAGPWTARSWCCAGCLKRTRLLQHSTMKPCSLTSRPHWLRIRRKPMLPSLI